MKTARGTTAHLQRMTGYFSLVCMLLVAHFPSSLFAKNVVYVDREDDCRSKTAYALVGGTVIALGAGIAYLLACSGSKCHHHSSHSDSYSSASWSPYDYYSSSYSHSHHHSHHRHHHHHRHHRHHHHAHGDLAFNPNEAARFSSSSLARPVDPQLIPTPIEYATDRKKVAKARLNEAKQALSGLFVVHPVSEGEGSLTVFVQLPDGSTQILGHLPISSRSGTSLSYGPFEQEGHYLFGISVDAGTFLPNQAKIGSVKINVNGLTTESHDFNLPAHPPANYEPAAYFYTLS